MRMLLENSTAFVFALLVIGIWTSLPYAVHELRADWERLRGQFGISFCLICSGLAGELLIDLVFFKSKTTNPSQYWLSVVPISFALTVVSVAGIVIAIRSMTVQAKGEWPWVRSVIIAALFSFVLWFIPFLQQQ